MCVSFSLNFSNFAFVKPDLMANFNEFVAFLSAQLWGWPMILLLLGTHIYLTVRLRCPQRFLMRAIKLSISKDKGASGDVSQFGAFVRLFRG